jgi:RHS repeat-associated protein
VPHPAFFAGWEPVPPGRGNLEGTILSIIYPSNHTFSYGVSKAERYTAAWDSPGDQFAQTASYAPMGALNSVIYGQVSGGFGGVTETRAYNSRLEFNSIQDSSSAGTAVNLSYNYVIGSSNNGSVGQVTNNSDSGRTQTFTYDTLNRILTAQSSATSGIDCWGEQFGGTGATLADDRFSNLTTEAPTKTGNGCFGGNLGLSVTNNQVTAPSPIMVDPASGNMTKDNRGFTYTYDAENRLTQANGMTNGPYCYTYDAFGLRVEKAHASGGACSGTVTVDKLYWRSIWGDTIVEADGSGSTTNSAYKEYVFFAGRRIASRDGPGNIYYYYTDHLGTTRSITDSHGNVCYDADFDAYGMEIVHTNTCPQNYKFTGYERDPETADPNTGLNGLDYALFRYYSSSLGRFLSADPLAGSLDPQSLNRYAYVGNESTNATDPVGLLCRADVRCPKNSLGPEWSSISAYGIDDSSPIGGYGVDSPLNSYYPPSGSYSQDLFQSSASVNGEPVSSGYTLGVTVTVNGALPQTIGVGIYGIPGLGQDSVPGGGGPQTPKPPQKKQPCPPSGQAPPPGFYEKLGESAGWIENDVYLFSFHRGGFLDAQGYGASPEYGNYVFGVYMAAAGYSLSTTLDAANAYGAVASKYPADKPKDPNYKHIPPANVANITNGYKAEQNGTLCNPY